MSRTLFSWTPSKLALLERRIVDGEATEIGRIEDAPYLGVSEPRGWDWFFGRPGNEPAFRPPFNERGEDVHRLLDYGFALVDEEGLGELRVGRGTIRCLEPRQAGDEVVLRDAWSTPGNIACRVVDAIQFALAPDAGRPIAVAFAQAPLLIAPPAHVGLAKLLESLSVPNQQALLRAFRKADAPEVPSSFHAIELREGDRIEVLGMTLDARRTRRFDIGQRAANYRETSNGISLVLGDAPGVRMVIRKIG